MLKIKNGKRFLFIATAIVLSITALTSFPTPVNASQKSDLYYSGLRGTFDSVPLHPMTTTGNYNLDAKLNLIFSSIISNRMDTHDKLKACYDYIINHTSYGINSFSGEDRYGKAYGLLKEGAGVCSDYASAFAVMARRIGLPMDTVDGETSAASGGFVGHTWCQMSYQGKTYIFDPQVEDDIAGSRKYILYIRFGGTASQLSGHYRNGKISFDFSSKAFYAAYEPTFCDTEGQFKLPYRTSYQFKLTSAIKPFFACASPSAFQISSIGSTGNNYFFKITAIGQPGSCAGFYINGYTKPCAVFTVT